MLDNRDEKREMRYIYNDDLHLHSFFQGVNSDA